LQSACAEEEMRRLFRRGTAALAKAHAKGKLNVPLALRVLVDFMAGEHAFPDEKKCYRQHLPVSLAAASLSQ
jgi:hypothetical protein